jgi:hypothetical protein
MWATSAGFDAALASATRTWRSRIEVLYGGQYVTTLTAVLDGVVRLDDVAVRRAADVTLVDPAGTLTPVTALDLLAPKGTELALAKGLVLPSGAVEWVPLGVFGIEEPEVFAHSEGTRITLKAFDRVAALRTRRFTTPWRVVANTATSVAIADIVTSRMSVPTRITATGHTTPELVFDELSDPWEAITALAEADGLVAYFDPLGTFVVDRREPVGTPAVYSEGPTSMLIETRRSIGVDKTYSGVIVTGEHPDHPPVRVELWDTDPGSPTYSDGPFGRRPYGFSSPLIKDASMANAAAASILARVGRMRQDVEITTVGHPGHEIADRVWVDDEASRTHGNYEVVSASIPLRPGMTTLRLRSVA